MKKYITQHARSAVAPFPIRRPHGCLESPLHIHQLPQSTSSPPDPPPPRPCHPPSLPVAVPSSSAVAPCTVDER